MARKASRGTATAHRGTATATLNRAIPVSARLHQPLPVEPGAPMLPRMSNIGGPSAIPGRKIVTLGWLPDWQSNRDYTLETPEIADELKKRDLILFKGAKRLQASVDNRASCSPIEDQGNLGSCTAQAAVGALEYLMRRANVSNYEGSRLFVYKVSRNLLGWTGDTGAFLRTSMQTVAHFGVPPETNWPYDITRFEEEPTSFLYSFAENFKAVQYARLDPRSTDRHETVTGDIVLDNVKHALQGGFPVIFGFTVYNSINNAPDIPYPRRGDRVSGGHAIMAVGYDDNHRTAAGEDEPSLIIRNSWGTGWGDGGYGYLPYRYLLKGLAQDFWAVFEWKWIDQGQFE